MHNMLQDVRYGFRTLRKNPGFACAAILVLALGVGANTAIFSVVNAVLLRPLPFPHPEELVKIWHTPPQASFPGMKEFAVSAANYSDWAAQNHVFRDTSIYSFASFNLTDKGEPEFLRARAVSSSFFSVLEAKPLLGRVFSPDEDQPGRNRVVVLTESFWRNHFASDPGVVGKDITLDGAAYRVIGVMRAKSQFPIPEGDDAIALWTPLAMTDREREVRGEHHYVVIGRLAPGVSIAQAQAEMDAISRRLEQQYPADDKGWGAVVKPLREDIVGDVRTPLLVLLGAVALVLLIACANAANLVLARTLARRKEIAVRSALGASRSRVIRQMISETVVLSFLAGIVGLLIATVGLKLLIAVLAAKLPRASQIDVDGSVLGFTVVVSILTGLLAGLAPAMRLSGVNVSESLKLGSRTSSEGSGTRTRNALVVSEVALSLMLLVGAGLMIRSLWMPHQVDPGIDPHNVVAVLPSISSTTFPEPQQQIGFYREVLRRISALPGVDSAGTIDSMPLENNGSNQPFQIVGRPVQAMADQPEVNVRLISLGYMRAMRIPLLRGREFDDRDSTNAPGAILISQSLAKKFWPNEDPVGQHVTMYFFPNKVREVVGIVGDVKDSGLNAKEPEPMLYMPLGQLEASATAAWRSFPLWVVARAKTDPTPLIPSLRNTIHEVNSALPIMAAARVENFVDSSLSQQRLNMLLLASFAGMALFLAAVGIYSVLAYNVRRRAREIGIRMALGAQTSNVVSMVFAEAMKPTLLGVMVGVAGALALGRFVSSLIYGVKASDFATFTTVSLVLVIVSFAASLVPAYRATRVQPVATLREE